MKNWRTDYVRLFCAISWQEIMLKEENALLEREVRIWNWKIMLFQVKKITFNEVSKALNHTDIIYLPVTQVEEMKNGVDMERRLRNHPYLHLVNSPRQATLSLLH